MPEYEAEVSPDQPWTENGTADVTPQPPYPNTATVNLSLEHREGGPVTVLRREYPSGLVIIPTDAPPENDPAILPMEVSSEDSVEVPNSGHQSWPNGIVVLFTQ